MRIFAWIGVLTLILAVSAGCVKMPPANSTSDFSSDETTNNTIASAGVMLTDEELEDRTLYLFDIYVFPVPWWTCSGFSSLIVNEFVDPLENTPEGTAFHPVARFDSIAEMKRATEQVVTKAYAEKNLYPNLDTYHQFLERDGKLYTNTEMGGGLTAFKPISAKVLTKTEQEAILSVLFKEPYGERETHEITLEKENGTWKLNNYPYYEFIPE